MSFIRWIPLLITLLAASSCTYNPEGIAFKEVRKVEDPQVSLSLSELSMNDTLYVYQPTSLRYDLSTKSGKILDVTVRYDGTTVQSDASAFGTIRLDGALLTTGVHNLRIEVTTTSGSGSLADLAGAEGFQVWKSLTVIIDVNPPPTPVPVFSTENGLLKISWTPFPGKNFLRYTVTVYDSRHGGSSVIDITDPAQASYVNPLYFGGYPIEYTVATHTFMHVVQSNPKTRSDNFAMTGSYSYADSTVTLAWDVADFPGAFKNYTILENGVPRESLVDVNTNTLTIRPTYLVFGYAVSFSVQLNGMSGQNVQPLNAFTVDRPIQTSSFSSQPSFITYSGTLGATVIRTQSPFRLQVVDNAWGVVDTFTGLTSAFVLPHDGNYFYTADPANNRLVRTDMTSRTSNYLNVLPMTTGGFLTNLIVTRASSNQVVVFIYRAHNSSGTFLVYHIRVYDWVNQVTLYHQETSILPGGPDISGNGQFLLFGDNLYQNVAGTVTFLRQLPAANQGWIFRPGNSNEVISQNSGNLSIIDAASGTLLRSIPPPAPGYSMINYDAATGYFLFVNYGEKRCYAVHIDTGHVVTIPAYHGSGSTLRLYNGYIIDQNGYYFKAL